MKTLIILTIVASSNLLFAKVALGQHACIYLVKNEEKNQANLFIKIDSAGISKNYGPDCFSEPVTRLTDGEKLSLIEKLLLFEKDSTLCWSPYFKLHPLSRQLINPESRQYRIQIRALLLINLLAFGSDVFKYSPFTVLCDTKTRKELDDQKSVSAVYAVYRLWFLQLKQWKFKSFTYPSLEKIGIKWFGHDHDEITYSGPGGWAPYFNCIQME